MSVIKSSAKKRIILTCISSFCLFFIFSQSLLSAKESSTESSRIVDFLNFICSSLGLNINVSGFFVRKAAHFFEFAVLGFSLYYTLCSYTTKKILSKVLIISGYISAAVIDECLQLFSFGRACSVSDMILDSFGGTFGLFVAILISFLHSTYIKNKSKNKGVDYMDNKTNKMGTQKMFPLIMSMSLPAMFSMIIQALYNVIDSVFLANYGENSEALTAVSLVYPLQLLLIAFIVGTGVGVNSLIARKLGEKQNEEASKVAVTGLCLAFFTWIIFAVIGIFFSRPFITLMAGSENKNIIEYGVEYISVVLIFSLGAFIQVMLEKCIQATGNMIFPMASHLIGAISNIILDPLFIFGIGPFPELGAKGAAIATVLGQWFAMLFLIIIVLVKKFDIKFSFKGFRLRLKRIKDIYVVSLSGIVMQAIGSVLVAGINIIISVAPSPDTVNSAAQTIFGIYYKIQSFVFMPVFGLNQGVSPIIGYNYGARKRKRMMSALKYALLISAAIMGIGTLIFQLFPAKILSMFNTSAELTEMGVASIRKLSLCFLPASIGVIMTALFQSVGKGIRSLLMSVLRQLVLILPIAFLLSKISIDMMWFAFPLAELGCTVVALLFFADLKKKEFSRLG